MLLLYSVLPFCAFKKQFPKFEVPSDSDLTISFSDFPLFREIEQQVSNNNNSHSLFLTEILMSHNR